MAHDPVPPDAVGVRLEIPIAVRNAIRGAAGRKGKSMAAYLRELVTEHAKGLPDWEGEKAPRKGNTK